MSKEMTPQEKSRELAEAIKFCLEKGLITPEEVQAAQSKEQKFQLACKARLRMELYLKKQTEERIKNISYPKRISNPNK